MRILITGASGFIGAALVRYMAATSHEVIAVYRGRHDRKSIHNVTNLNVEDLTDIPNDILRTIDVVIHAAGFAHVNDQDSVAKEIFEVNVRQTCLLFDQCCVSDVNKVINISSMAVYGDNALLVDDLTEISPTSLYGYSKLVSEQHLFGLSSRSDLEYTNLRPPLVYGQGAPGNYERVRLLMERVGWLPVPLPDCENSRTFLSVKGLCSAVEVCITSSVTNGKSYIVADARGISTYQFFNAIAGIVRAQTIRVQLPEYVSSVFESVPVFRKLYKSMYSDLEVVTSKELTNCGYAPLDTLSELNKLITRR